MSDGREYHQQMAQLQSALRERELHRLDLEKENLAKIQRREKRHEQLRSKIKALHKELVQEEIESTQRVTLLLSQVDSVRREYELLQARTERLRQKKHQYELFLGNTNPGLVFHGASSYGPLNIKGTGQDVIRLRPPSNTSRVLPSSVSSIQQRYQHPYVPYSVSPAAAAGTSVPIHVASHVATQGIGDHATSVASLNTQPPVGNGRGSLVRSHSQEVASSGLLSLIPTLEHSERAAADSSEFHKLHFRVPNGSNSETLSGGQDPRVLGAGNTIDSALSLDSCVAESRLSFRHQDLNQQVTERIPERQQVFRNPHSSIDAREISSGGHLPSSEKLPPKHPSQPSTSSVHHPQSSVVPGHLTQMFQLHEYPMQPSLPPGDPQQSSIPPEHYSQSSLPPRYTTQPSIAPGYPLQPSTQIGYPTQLPSTSNYPSQQSMTPSYPPQPFTQAGHPAQPSVTPNNPPQPPTQAGYPTQQSVTSGQLPQSAAPEGHLQQPSIPTAHSPQEPMPLCPNSDQLLKLSELASKDGVQPADGLALAGLSPVKYVGPLRQDPGTEDPHATTVYREASAPLKSSNSRRESEILMDSSCSENSPGSAKADLDGDSAPRSTKEEGEMDNASELSRHNEFVSRQSNASDDYERRNEHLCAPLDSRCEAQTLDPSSQDDESLPVEKSRKQAISTKNPVSEESHEDINSRRLSLVSAGLPESGLERLKEATIRHSLTDVRETSNLKECDYDRTSNERSNSNETIASPSRHSSPSRSSVSKHPEDLDVDDDSDFFGKEVAPITASRAYKSLLGDMAVGGPAITTESDSDDIEGQMTSLAVRDTSMKRPSYRPFASGIPSLRPAAPGTDSDSVDSVEAAIQAAVNKPRQGSEVLEKTPEKGQKTTTGPASMPNTFREMEKQKQVIVKLGGGSITKKPKTSAALSLKLESDSESYGVSGGDNESEDDFDFYD